MKFIEMARNTRRLRYADWIETKTRLEGTAKQTKGAEEARELLKGFETYDPEPGINRTTKVALLDWETHDAGPLMRGFAGSDVVATICKRENHRQVNGEVEVYELAVLGETIPDLFHHIKDARQHGSRLYAERRGETA